MSPIKDQCGFLVSQHWLSLLGMAQLATALLSSIFVLPQQVRGHVDNPHVGITIFLVLSIICFGGLILIPIGIYLGKRKNLSQQLGTYGASRLLPLS